MVLGDYYPVKRANKWRGTLYEVVSTTSGVQYRHNILAPGGVVAVHTLDQNGNATTSYLHSDHLGSTDSITNDQGTVAQQMSFDAFGIRRDPANWAYDLNQGQITQLKSYTDFGYTGQEDLDSVGLVHMNGRAYDPTTGRFISADPVVQNPVYTQAFNRYTYVYNNPLNATDPSGFDCDSGDDEGDCDDNTGDSSGDNTPSPITDPGINVPDPTLSPVAQPSAAGLPDETGSNIPGVSTGAGGTVEYGFGPGAATGSVYVSGYGTTDPNSNTAAANASATAQNQSGDTAPIQTGGDGSGGSGSTSVSGTTSPPGVGFLGKIEVTATCFTTPGCESALLSNAMSQYFQNVMELAALGYAEAGVNYSRGAPNSVVAAESEVRNRVESDGFPYTYHGVIFEPGNFAAVGTSRFATALNVPNQLTGAAAQQYAYALATAVGIVNDDGSVQDPTNGATFFYSGTAPPDEFFCDGIGSGRFTASLVTGFGAYQMTFLIDNRNQ